MRSDNFNETAMELKIKNNEDRGFNKKQIQIELMKEYMQVLENMKPLQIRAVELSDQIDYMKDKYPIKREKKMKRIKLIVILLLGLLAFSLPAEAITFKSITYREHATDCTTLVNGKTGHYCWELDSSTLWKCVPSLGACDTAGEWKKLDVDHDAITNFVAAEHVTEASISHDTIAGVSTSDHHTATVNTDAETKCTGNQILEGDGDCVATPVGGGGTMSTIKENNVQVGGADIVVLDFLGADFNLAESPDTEIQVVIDDGGIDHDATTNFVAAEHVTEASISHDTIAGVSTSDHHTATVNTDAETKCSGNDVLEGDGDCVASAGTVDYTGVIFVGKHGNDANDGLNPNDAKLTVAAANTASVSGNTIYVFPGSYNESEIALKAGVNLVGMDRDNTIITAAVSAGTNGDANGIIMPVGDSYIADISLLDTNDASVIFTNAITLAVASQTVIAENVYLTGGYDGIYMDPGTDAISLEVYDSLISTAYDGIGVWSDNGSSVKIFNTEIITAATAPTNKQEVCVGTENDNTGTTLIYLFNVRCVVNGGSSDSYVSGYTSGAKAGGNQGDNDFVIIGGSIEVTGNTGQDAYGVRITSSATNADIDVFGTRIIVTGADNNYDAGENAGTITFGNVSHNDTFSGTITFLESGHDYIWTGVHDYGTGTLEMPNSGAPSLSIIGQFALDTSVTGHEPLVHYMGDELMAIIGIPSANLSTVDNSIIKYDISSGQFFMEPDIGGVEEDEVGTTELNDGTDIAAADKFVMIDNSDLTRFSYINVNDCPDSAGNHLNYDAATQTLICGSTSSSGTPTYNSLSDPTAGSSLEFTSFHNTWVSNSTTVDFFTIVATNVTTASALVVKVADDVMTTGKAIEVLSGPSADTSVWDVDKNGNTIQSGSATTGGTEQSTANEGLKVNDLAGSDEDDDFIVVTGNYPLALEVDAGDDQMKVGIDLLVVDIDADLITMKSDIASGDAVTIDNTVTTGNALRILGNIKADGYRNLAQGEHFQDVLDDGTDIVSMVSPWIDATHSLGVGVPDVARTISCTITCVGIGGEISSGTITITGVSASGNDINEALAVNVTQAEVTETYETNRAFITVASIVTTGQSDNCAASDLTSCDLEDTFGLMQTLDSSIDVYKVKEDNADVAAYSINTTYSTFTGLTITGGEDISVWMKKGR